MTVPCADARKPVDDARARRQQLGKAFDKEQGSPGLRFYTRGKTSAVRFAW